MQRLDVLIADDHPIFVVGLKTILQQIPGFSIGHLQIARNGVEVLTALQQHSFDLLLLDLNMPEIDGLEVLKLMNHQHLVCPTIVLSMYNNPKLVKLAVDRGAKAYVHKSNAVGELGQAIQAAQAGDTYLGEGVCLPGEGLASPRSGRKESHLGEGFLARYRITRREKEVLKLVVQGFNNKEIADHLFISEQTVNVHRKNMMRKLDVGNTASLVRMAYECRLL